MSLGAVLAGAFGGILGIALTRISWRDLTVKAFARGTRNWVRDAESKGVSQLTAAEVANFRRQLDKHHGRQEQAAPVALRSINFTAIRETSLWN